MLHIETFSIKTLIEDFKSAGCFSLADLFFYIFAPMKAYYITLIFLLLASCGASDADFKAQSKALKAQKVSLQACQEALADMKKERDDLQEELEVIQLNKEERQLKLVKEKRLMTSRQWLDDQDNIYTFRPDGTLNIYYIDIQIDKQGQWLLNEYHLIFTIDRFSIVSTPIDINSGSMSFKTIDDEVINLYARP